MVQSNQRKNRGAESFGILPPGKARLLAQPVDLKVKQTLSHGRGRKFKSCRAHQINQQLSVSKNSALWFT